MPNLKKYRVAPDDVFASDGFFAELEIDHDKFDPFALDIVKFWAGWQCKLAPDGSNKVEIALEHVASFVLGQVAEGESDRACTAAFGHAEGWPLAHEMGVRVLSVEFFDLSTDAVRVEELDHG